ncbi:MAG: dTDP-4-dehydrorhamnose reductase [Bryobacteraceae bacterium]|jgi:dTDP-4-dehydrorhamnose reductase
MSHRDSKNAVIFGSAGQLGVELMRVFRKRGYEVQGYDRDVVDICDAAAVEAVLARADPALVLNAAAYNMVDVAEHEPAVAFQANALAVRNVAMACRQVDAQLVHYSTDYVFDGTAGRPYTEQDKPHPLGAYAVSKYAGELYAEAYLESPLIVRTSGLFGPGGLHTARGNFIELMLRLAGGSQPIRVVEDHVASPAYAPALAERTAQLVERNATGVFHVGGGTPISWFEFARLIFRLAGVTPELRPTSEREYRTEARRPRFSALSNSKMEAFGIAPMPSMEEAVADYFERRKEHAARQSSS